MNSNGCKEYGYKNQKRKWFSFFIRSLEVFIFNIRLQNDVPKFKSRCRFDVLSNYLWTTYSCSEIVSVDEIDFDFISRLDFLSCPIQN